MGEEAKQEQPKVEEKKQEKQEEKAEEKKEEKQEEKVEEKKEEPKPPSPCVLFVDLHCMGCAKKIQKSVMKMRGVEGVVIDMAKNEVTIKGIVEPQAICNRITKKIKRRAKIISPLPEAEGEPIPEVVTSQVSEPVTLELNVNMHCEACAEQLKKKILKMRGVQTAETELSTGKVTVTGTMDANKLVDYLYRSTRKQVTIVPQAKPESEPEKNEAEEVKPEEKKEEETPAEEGKKEEGDGSGENKSENNEEEKGGEEEGGGGGEQIEMINMEDERMKRMMYYYQPLYVVERIPPPQLFSDENPNACCIS
ncbi:heavy metal-associated isoprenylated plant protein 9 [Neltuma alba]|uniref:heavy metal-associated isoprenylated plant protein 9 n=1 Tax=Neltuma alba TaxID=207710 RepID=UPI0010A4F02D|nr:heavy metal-associated isoprenylated plant protein 9 [Prosopis alba]